MTIKLWETIARALAPSDWARADDMADPLPHSLQVAIDHSLTLADRVLPYCREYTEETCPGHASDPKRCWRCGVHVDSLRAEPLEDFIAPYGTNQDGSPRDLKDCD
jgi:hypothetical protein